MGDEGISTGDVPENPTPSWYTALTEVDDGLADDIAALDTRADALETLTGAAGGIDVRLDALEAADTSLDGRLDTLETLTGSGGGIDVRLDALEAEDTSLDGRLDALELLAITRVVKSTPEDVTSSAVLQNDDELLLAVGASSVWEFSGILICYSGSGTPDIKFAFTVPAGATLLWTITGAGVGVATVTSGETVSGTAGGNHSLPSGSVPVYLNVRVYVSVAGTPGNLQLQWAQNTSNGTPTTVGAGSYLIGRRVA